MFFGKLIKIVFFVLVPIAFVVLLVTYISYKEDSARVTSMPPPAPSIPVKMPVKPKTSDDNKWYTIERDSFKCNVSESPAEIIKTFRAVLKQFETNDDVIEDGKAMQVTFSFKEPDGSYYLTYYRGKERCKDAAAKRKSQSEAELKKYR